jgi:hypothetical protein
MITDANNLEQLREDLASAIRTGRNLNGKFWQDHCKRIIEPIEKRIEQLEGAVRITNANLKRIHINQHNIRHNAKCDPSERLPVVTVKTGGKNYRCDEAIVDGRSRIVYSPEKPLSCGAKVWIETNDMVEIIGLVSVAVSVNECAA